MHMADLDWVITQFNQKCWYLFSKKVDPGSISGASNSKGATLTLPTTGTIVQNLKADGEQYTLFSLRENGLV